MADFKKIKVAFLKFSGCAAGGTERYLQTIAALLSKSEKYEVDYYYCDAAPYIGSDWKHPDTDISRIKYLEENGVNLIKFKVEAKDITQAHHPWINTNFWEVFDESKYDIIQLARAGHSEFPFTEINKTTIIDGITLPGMAERKENVFKVMHISQWQANTWIAAGGEASKVEIVPIFQEMEPHSMENFRNELGIGDDKFIFGLHQRENNEIVSTIPLQAYKAIENENTVFVLMGGGDLYRKFALENKLKNFYHIPYNGDNKIRDKFLATLNAYAHGRQDGETFSLCIAEAMYYKLPIISHIAPAMGHVETIGDAGVVCSSLEDYIAEMKKLIPTDEEYYQMRSQNAVKRYTEHYSHEAVRTKVLGIYESLEENKKIDELSDKDFWESMF